MEGIAGRAPHRLSFGERKRVALATILSMGPEILALDEPTGNLDPRERREFMELIRGLEATVIIATHDLELVLELCERAVLMDGGASDRRRSRPGDPRRRRAHVEPRPRSLTFPQEWGPPRVEPLARVMSPAPFPVHKGPRDASGDSLRLGNTWASSLLQLDEKQTTARYMAIGQIRAR